MGWGGGTELFDTVAKAIQSHLAGVMRIESCEEDLRQAYIEIIDAFRDNDWDNSCESEYYEHPFIGPLLKIDEEDEDGC